MTSRSAGVSALLLAVASFGWSPSTARAVDFKIDLPPMPTFGGAGGAGEEDTRETSDELQNAIDAAQSVDVPFGGTADGASLDGASEPVSPAPAPQGRRAVRPGRSSSQALRAAQPSNAPGAVNDSTGFPMKQCLVSNVKFWERVYSEVDEHQVIVHDRDDLSIIYAIVNVPPLSRKGDRQSAMRLWRTHFERQLGSLSTKAKAPSLWSPEERKVARRIPQEKLTEAWLRGAPSNIRFQGGMRTRFEGGVSRSVSYMPTIHPIITDAGLPSDIVHLPHVESSYVPYARSKVGAVGLWQIMPGTMRLVMGSHAVHRRTDVRTATEAAARILRQNFEATRSWPLALTAYNHGLGGVLRAVRQTGSRDLCDIIERYESPSFRFASSNFYAQFLAARNLVLQRYETLANERGAPKVLKEVLASLAKEGST